LRCHLTPAVKCVLIPEKHGQSYQKKHFQKPEAKALEPEKPQSKAFPKHGSLRVRAGDAPPSVQPRDGAPQRHCAGAGDGIPRGTPAPPAHGAGAPPPHGHAAAQPADADALRTSPRRC